MAELPASEIHDLIARLEEGRAGPKAQAQAAELLKGAKLPYKLPPGMLSAKWARDIDIYVMVESYVEPTKLPAVSLTQTSAPIPIMEACELVAAELAKSGELYRSLRRPRGRRGPRSQPGPLLAAEPLTANAIFQIHATMADYFARLDGDHDLTTVG